MELFVIRRHLDVTGSWNLIMKDKKGKNNNMNVLFFIFHMQISPVKCLTLPKNFGIFTG